MKKHFNAALVAAMLLVPSLIFTQNYNPATVETVKGVIISIDKIPSGNNSAGIHLVLQTDKETISIHVGPEWYLSKQDLQLKVNDNIEIKGSRITYEQKPAIIAAEIGNGNSTLKLRDANGIPSWSRGKN